MKKNRLRPNWFYRETFSYKETKDVLVRHSSSAWDWEAGTCNYSKVPTYRHKNRPVKEKDMKLPSQKDHMPEHDVTFHYMREV